MRAFSGEGGSNGTIVCPAWESAERASSKALEQAGDGRTTPEISCDLERITIVTEDADSQSLGKGDVSPGDWVAAWVVVPWFLINDRFQEVRKRIQRSRHGGVASFHTLLSRHV